MFNAYEFTFGNESSLMYDLMIYDFDGHTQSDVSFGNKADIIETRTNNRIHPLHFGVNYHKEPLTFKLTFGSDRPLDRYELENIACWLTGHQDYQWLSICQADLEAIQYRCLITSLTPISHSWLPVAFEAEVRCDCAYAYGYPYEKEYKIEGETAVLFRNESGMKDYYMPFVTFIPASGVSELSICNLSDGGREFRLTEIPEAVESVLIDNSNGIISDSSNSFNLYKGFNLNFLRLLPGDNRLKVAGDGTLIFSGRFLHNVSA